MLRFDAVTKTFPAVTGMGNPVAVNSLSFEVAAGEACCLLGPNGAGKTTSIMMLLGFLKPTSGDIVVWGDSVVSSPEIARRKIAYIPDNVALYENLTGYQNLRFFDRLLGNKRDDAAYRGFSDRVGLAATALEKPLRTYSRGMRQRLGIAVALLKDASLYVLDEPTGGLDPKGIRELFAILCDLRDHGKALLVTTHDLMHVPSFANKVLFIVGGNLVESIEGESVKQTNLEEMYLRIIAR